MSDLLLSIVVPTLNEVGHLPGLLRDLALIGAPHEVVVSDGGSGDGTADAAAAGGARLVSGPRGRGTQLLAGARAAQAPLLCFLHADARLPSASAALLTRLAVLPPKRPAAFRLAIDAPGLIYRVLERGTNLRTRWFGLPFGDQGLVIPRDLYFEVGGHPPQPLMEDVALALALRQRGGIGLLDESVSVSARRWKRDGPIRRTIMNLFLLTRYLLGAAPERLAAKYGAEPTGG